MPDDCYLNRSERADRREMERGIDAEGEIYLQLQREQDERDRAGELALAARTPEQVEADAEWWAAHAAECTVEHGEGW